MLREDGSIRVEVLHDGAFSDVFVAYNENLAAKQRHRTVARLGPKGGDMTE
jgi:hypothetical protein